jgi:hypothetical protein
MTRCPGRASGVENLHHCLHWQPVVLRRVRSRLARQLLAIISIARHTFFRSASFRYGCALVVLNYSNNSDYMAVKNNEDLRVSFLTFK